jgi:RNA methyltransferase, TrmH family
VAVLTRAEERLIRRLRESRRRRDEGLFLAEGVRLIEELLDAGVEVQLALVSPALAETDRGAALSGRLAGRVGVRELSDAELSGLAATRSPQGVLAVARIPSVELAAMEPGGAATALILDGVQDPGNIGTLARAAVAFGCDLLACLPGTVDPWNPKAVRASAGALFRVPVIEVAPADLWEWLERHGFAVLGADAAGEPVAALPRSQRTALVVGNEGAGLGDEVRARCQRLVAVPMRAGTESLNVAVATGILLYELTRERI